MFKYLGSTMDRFFNIAVVSISIMLILITSFSLAQQANPYYYFSDNGMECVVKESHLPRPWLNRLGNDVFFTWVTHNGYIESFLIDPNLNGLVNPQTVSGHFFIRDNQSNDYFLLNESDGDEPWSGTIGLGYNKLYKKKNEMETELTYFIPRAENVLLALIKVTNLSDHARDISIFGQVEWSLGDRVKTITYETNGVGGSQHNLYKKVFFEENVLYGEQNNWKHTATSIPWPYTGYFTTSESVQSFETLTGNFLGRKGSWKDPMAVVNGICSNTEFWSYDENPLGVLQVGLSLKPGETREMVYMLGMEKTRDEIDKVVQKYSDVAITRSEFETTKSFYTNFLDNTITIETPDKPNDRIINIWSQYHWRQWLKRELDSEGYGAGMWAYGLEGNRVVLHPEFLLVPLDLGILKKSIRDILLKNQTPGEEGSNLSSWPYAMIDSETGEKWPPADIRGRFDVPHHHQIYVFLFSIYFYLLETADVDLLNEVVPYIDGTEASVFEHIKTAMAMTVKVLNERGLALIPQDTGDWMDEFTKISQKGEAESVMLANQVAFLLKGYAEIARKIKENEVAEQWMAYYDKIREGVNNHAWDGEWYIRAFADSGDTPQSVGSQKNEEGKIYLNAQSWPILSGVATPERADRTLESVQRHLSTKYGPLVFWPSYTKYVDYIGTQSIYAPGFRNGNIYFRPAGWAIIAAAMRNRADLANELYYNTSLAVRSEDTETYLLEPFVYPENYIGPDHPRKGEGQFHWCFGEGTGWMWYAYVNYILGIRAEWDGLKIDPKIPSEWKEYKVKRPFRGAVYNIEVKNPENVSTGIKWIRVDGKRIKGNLIPAHQDNQTHQIEVMMGK